MNCFFLSVILALSLPVSKQDDGFNKDALYSSLDPRSLAQNLAFYNLYPSSPEATTALTRALSILELDKNPNMDNFNIPTSSIEK